MKKILAFILALTMLMSLAACGSKEPASEPADTPAVDTPADPGNEPAAPGEGPETDDMPEVSDTDIPTEAPAATDTDLPVDGDAVTLNILSTVWATYADEEKFAAAGGDAANMTMDGPGSCDISDTAGMDSLFGLPESAAASVTEAASLLHMMNANTFTSACYALADGTDVNAFVEEVKANILARQWMCGFPETLIIVDVDGCIVTAFGNDDIIQLFKTKLADSFSTNVLVEEPIA